MSTNARSRTTNALLLSEVRDWGNGPAWSRLHTQYDARLHVWGRRLGLDPQLADELCQRIWIDLMKRLPTFRYDPSRSFGAWLKRLFRSRAIDLLRERPRAPERLWVEVGLCDDVIDDSALEDPDEEFLHALSPFLEKGDLVQRVVRARVDEETWLAFWMINVEDVPVADAAAALGKKYSAVYNASRRVESMLRTEGLRLALEDARATG